MTAEVKKWRHSRMGLIEGVEVGNDDHPDADTWMRVRLSRDHAIRWFSTDRRGEVTPTGTVIAFRRSFMAEVVP